MKYLIIILTVITISSCEQDSPNVSYGHVLNYEEIEGEAKMKHLTEFELARPVKGVKVNFFVSEPNSEVGQNLGLPATSCIMKTTRVSNEDGEYIANHDILDKPFSIQTFSNQSKFTRSTHEDDRCKLKFSKAPDILVYNQKRIHFEFISSSGEIDETQLRYVISFANDDSNIFNAPVIGLDLIENRFFQELKANINYKIEYGLDGEETQVEYFYSGEREEFKKVMLEL